MPCTFKDADKKANDLFKRNFVKGNTIKTKIKTATGVEFSTESKNGAGVFEDKAGSFATKLAAKFKHKATGFSVDKFEVDSQAKGFSGPSMTSEVSLVDPSLPAAKFSLKTVIANDGDWKKEMAEIGAQYSDDMWLASAKVDPVNWGGSANVVVTAEGFLFGMEGTFSTPEGYSTSMKDMDMKFSAIGGYHSGDFKGMIRCNKDKDFTISAHHQVCKSLEVATIVTAPYAGVMDKGAALTSKLKVGGKYSFEDGSTLSGSLTCCNDLDLTYAQKIFPTVKLSVGTSIKLSKDGKFGAGAGSKTGFQLEFGDI